jgi:uncharacterized membrane protein YbhN (UPF0104 family)
MVRAAWAWTRVLGGVGILAFVLWRLGTGAFLDGLHLLNGWTLAAALGIGVMTTVFSAWRWCLVAGGLGIRLPLRTAIADYYRALFVNAALPSGILGDVHRAVRNGKDNGDVGRGVRAVVLERFAGQVVLITFGVTVLLSHPVLSRHVNLPRALVAIVGVALVLVGAVLWIRRRGGTSRIGRGLRTGMTDVRRGLLARNRWPLLVRSSAIVVAGHLAMFVVAARAAGSHAPFLRLLPLMMLALFAMTLPVNVGGWGPREGVTAWAFGAAGLGATQGLTIAVLYGLFAFIAALPGVVVIVGQWVARLTAARAQRAQRAESAGSGGSAEAAGRVGARDFATSGGLSQAALIATDLIATDPIATDLIATDLIVTDLSDKLAPTEPFVDIRTVAAPVCPASATSTAPVALAPSPVASIVAATVVLGEIPATHRLPHGGVSSVGVASASVSVAGVNVTSVSVAGGRTTADCVPMEYDDANRQVAEPALVV